MEYYQAVGTKLSCKNYEKLRRLVNYDVLNRMGCVDEAQNKMINQQDTHN